MKKTIALLAVATTLAIACDENPDQPSLGTLAITSTAPTVEAGFRTIDEWDVRYTKFLVNVNVVTVAGFDGVVTATAESQLFDQVSPGPKPLLEATNRVARAWEDVSFEIGPTTLDTTPLEPVTELDRNGLLAGGVSVLVEGTMTKVTADGVLTKTFRWGLTPRTGYRSCAGRVNDALQPGLVVPTNGADSADIIMDGSVLFFDNLAAQGRVLRGDPIAAADTNNDNVIGFDELTDVPLEEARESTGLYGPLEGVEDLGAFVNAQARSIVVGFRSEGDCRIEPLDNAP